MFCCTCLGVVLYSFCRQTHSDEGWLEDEGKPLAGFAWRGGAERETTGILMWSEPFIVPNENGQEVGLSLENCLDFCQARLVFQSQAGFTQSGFIGVLRYLDDVILA